MKDFLFCKLMVSPASGLVMPMHVHVGRKALLNQSYIYRENTRKNCEFCIYYVRYLLGNVLFDTNSYTILEIGSPKGYNKKRKRRKKGVPTGVPTNVKSCGQQSNMLLHAAPKIVTRYFVHFY